MANGKARPIHLSVLQLLEPIHWKLHFRSFRFGMCHYHSVRQPFDVRLWRLIPFSISFDKSKWIECGFFTDDDDNITFSGVGRWISAKVSAMAIMMQCTKPMIIFHLPRVHVHIAYMATDKWPKPFRTRSRRHTQANGRGRERGCLCHWQTCSLHIAIYYRISHPFHSDTAHGVSVE